MRFIAFAPAQAGLLSPQISHHLFLIKCTHQNNQQSIKHACVFAPKGLSLSPKNAAPCTPLSSPNTSNQYATKPKGLSLCSHLSFYFEILSSNQPSTKYGASHTCPKGHYLCTLVYLSFFTHFLKYYPQTNHPSNTPRVFAPKGLSLCSHLSFYFEILSSNHLSTKYGASHTCPARVFFFPKNHPAPYAPISSLNTSIPSTKRTPCACPARAILTLFFHFPPANTSLLNQPSSKYGASHTCPARASHKKRNNLFSTPHSIPRHSVFYHQTNHQSNTPRVFAPKGLSLSPKNAAPCTPLSSPNTSNQYAIKRQSALAPPHSIPPRRIPFPPKNTRLTKKIAAAPYARRRPYSIRQAHTSAHSHQYPRPYTPHRTPHPRTSPARKKHLDKSHYIC